MSGYGAFARYYDVLTTNVDYPARAQKLDKLIRAYFRGAQSLLDLACGTGSFSLQFAQLGYDVTGIDVSAEMLSAAMQKAGMCARSVLFLQQDMRELDLYGTVDVAVCCLDSLNHLPDAEAFAQALNRVSLFLNPGGLCLFDLNTPYKHREILGQNMFVYELPEVYCVWRNRFDERDGSVQIALDFFEPLGSGRYRRETECFYERAYPDACVENAITRAGLKCLAVLDGDTFGKPAPNSQRLLYVTKQIHSRQKKNGS